jgi:hypothetical protein
MPALWGDMGMYEPNYHHECPYPTKTLCTKCWTKDTPKDS